MRLIFQFKSIKFLSIGYFRIIWHKSKHNYSRPLEDKSRKVDKKFWVAFVKSYS